MDNLQGKNIIVLDLESAASAADCRYCGEPQADHQPLSGGALCRRALVRPGSAYTKIGWNDKQALGLSIGCYWDYQDMALHWFDPPTLEATMRLFVERQPLLVSFNGIQFDFALMRALLRHRKASTERHQALVLLCDAFKVLCAASYDILATIWQVDAGKKFGHDLNGLGAISEANGYGCKEMDGTEAPRRWRAGHYAEVIAYNVSDVRKTQALFEQIIETGTILRGDGQRIALPRPQSLAGMEDV